MQLYLCQSPYFQSMFSGAWRESNMKRIDVQVADPNVTLDSLAVALGSLYQDEIVVEPAKVSIKNSLHKLRPLLRFDSLLSEQVIPVLSTAILLQLDGLIDQCVAMMVETINVRTVVHFHEAAALYGCSQVEEACLAWLKVNLLSHMPEHPDKLRNLPQGLMASLVASPDLFVMQTEFSVYVLLRLWLFLRFRPHWDGNPQDAVYMSHRFFQVRIVVYESLVLDADLASPFIRTVSPPPRCSSWKAPKVLPMSQCSGTCAFSTWSTTTWTWRCS